MTEENTIQAKQSYNYTWEIISLISRIVATILLEIAIAFLFGYRKKNALVFIAAVNIITQVILNVGLNIVNYNSGSMAFTASFVLFEIIVFAVEAVVYSLMLNRFASKTENKARPAAYAFAANLASFAVGLWLSHIIPGIF